MELADLKLRFSTAGEGQAVSALRSVDSELKATERDAHSAGGALKGMFSTAAGFALGGGLLGAVGAVKGAIGGIINADAAMEQSKVILTQVTGSAEKANELIKSVQKEAAATPFSFGELIQSTQELEAFGMKSQDWLNVIGDTAAGTGKSVEQVTQAVLDAHTGQYERLKELGIDTQIENDKLVFQYSKNGQTIRKEVDKTNQAVIDSTLQGIWNDKYQGMMEKQSHTFVGQWSTLKDNVSMTLQGMSGGIFSFVRDGMGYLNGMFTQFQLMVANGVSPFQAAIETLGDAIADVFGQKAANAFYSVVDFGKNVAKLAGDIISAFGEGSPVKQILKDLPASWQPVASVVLRVADALGDLWSAFRSGGLSGLVHQLHDEVMQLAGAFKDAVKITVRVAWDIVWSGTRDLAQAVKDYAGYGGNPELAGLADPTNQTIPWPDVIAKALVHFQADFSQWDNDLTKALGLDANQAQIDAAGKSGEALGQAAAAKVAEGIGKGVDAAGGTGDKAKDNGGVWASIKKILVWEPPFARGGTPSVFDEAEAWAQGFGQGIRDHIVNAISGVFNGTSEYDVASGTMGAPDGGLAQWLNTMGQGIVNALQAWAQSLTQWFTDNGTAVVQPIVDFFTGIPGAVKDLVKEIKLDIPTPTLPDWLTNFDWITKPIATLAEYVAQLLSLRSQVSQYTMPPAPGMAGYTGTVSPGLGGGGSGADYTGNPGLMQTPHNPEPQIQTLTTAIKVPAPDWSAFGHGLESMATATQTNTNAVTDQFVQLRNNAQNLADSTNNAVTNAFVAMRNNVGSLMGSVVANVTGALSGLPGFAGSEGYAIGDALGSGIYNGIGAWATTIAAEAAAIVSVAILAARAAAGAHSPSRKMMQLGNDMMAGLLIPLQAGRPQVAGAMNNLLAFPAGGRNGYARSGNAAPVVQHVYQEGAFKGALISADFERRMEKVAESAADRKINSRRLGESR